MDEPLVLSASSLQVAGILLLAVVTVESGGLYLVRVLRGGVALTPFQMAFHRAGHAHAGVLVVLSLVIQPFVDASGLEGAAEFLARSGVPAAAILMPAGFFLSTLGHGATAPNRLVWLLYAGAVSLAAGTIVLGLGLLLG